MKRRTKKLTIQSVMSSRYLSLFFFFCSFGVASDTDHGFAAKLNQAIMACISILSHVAKYLYPHILLSAPYQSPLLSITCSNNSVQRCAVGQSRPAVTEVRCITSSGKIFSLRKACVMADISALDSWVWRPSFVFSRAGMWSCFRGVSVASRASSNTSKQIQPGWGAFPCRTGSRRGMDRGGGRQAIVSFCSWGELFPQDQTSSELWEGQGALNMIWRDGKVETGEDAGGNRGVRESQRSVLFLHCPILRHVMFSYLFPLLPSFPLSLPPNFSRLPTLQLEDMIVFPCWDSL